ncbi:polysaccharide deacetylase family protein [Zunongwangia sp. HRR-M8]|uniref:polysaccharide deacetylase family protein n=1 Tax=Zunongwangia sp. HRR-M8 TaxID=3015170 RepID=UPI0022DE297E|nr:polysaccharide deacetylase family protein [Zunongwangia sp. HRR-M8]WBL20847.1 polysaccharide deacetylase family protein [Zunongwangia sp. HRR-M8]
MKFRILNFFIWIFLIAVAMYCGVNGLALWPIAAAAIMYPVFLITISTNIRWNVFAKGFHHQKDHPKKEVCLSFDDGPTNVTPKILDLLDRYDAKACFFCIGEQMEKYPEIAQDIIERGHIIGNHTYSHTRKMGFLSSKSLAREIDACNIIANDITGLNLNLFRPPFGIINPKTKSALDKTGHLVIGWNLRTYDAILNDKSKIVNRIKRKLKPGDVILLHDNKDQTPIILEQLLLHLKSNGYRAIRPDQLFKINAYN